MNSVNGNYRDFLATKLKASEWSGFEVADKEINQDLFPFQRRIVTWALGLGRAAIFADCGLGKTPMQLEWARHVHEYSGGDVLILAPLAVAGQTREEGAKFGVDVTVCREMSDVQPGINVTNYDRLDRFDPTAFSGVVLDESSVLKAYSSKRKIQLIEMFRETPYKLCCTATPAPNDHIELGNHAEFLGIMRSTEMLSRWFINDTMNFGTWRLKGHAERAFWDWVASWAIAIRRPSDLGDDDGAFDLPPLNVHELIVPVDVSEDTDGKLFRMPVMSATEIYREMRLTTGARASAVAEMVNADTDAWAVWCNTNHESETLAQLIPDAVEVRGSDKPEDKERKLAAFSSGEARVIVTKPSIAGFGLNWQHCHKTAFVGLSYSFEQLYQAMRRIYRFGQDKPVQAHIVVAETEDQVLATIKRKIADHERLNAGLYSSAQKLMRKDRLSLVYEQSVEVAESNDDYTVYQGDCVVGVSQLDDASIDFSIYSPPFSQLYIYSDALQDMGNSADDHEFFEHYGFLIDELYRVTRPGRLSAVHCKQLVNYKGRDGMAGLRDFRGEIIRAHVERGWAYHSEVVIWKDPVIEMQRTKAHGLLYKQLRADSSFSRQGMAEYLLVFRRWPQDETEESEIVPVTHTKDDFPLPTWQKYASPVWDDIRQTNVLNIQQARDERDEKHICPLQLDVIERALELWTNPGELVLDPFGGIQSTGYVALQMDRRYVGFELKQSYINSGLRFLREAMQKRNQVNLFSMNGVEVS